MKWSEFKALLIGIDPKTPLGRIVSIRSEEDKETLKYFNKDQMRIRNEWRSRKAKEVSKKQLDDFLDQMKQAFILMAGGGKN